MKVRFRIFFSLSIILLISGCSSLDVNEAAWARCSVGGTLLVSVIAVSSGGNLVASSILGGANSSIGCFLVYEKDGFDTGKKSFELAALERKAAKQKKKQKEKDINPTSSTNSLAQSSNSPAMPVIPLLPVISALPIFETEIVVAVENVIDSEQLEEIASVDVEAVIDETAIDSTEINSISLPRDPNLALVFDGSIGTLDEPLIIYFEGRGLEVEQSGKDDLADLAIWLNENPDAEIELIGHSDVDGTDSYSLQLSLQRAEEVMNLLIELEVDEFRILMDYRGREELVAENDTDENRALNRRVEVIWQ